MVMSIQKSKWHGSVKLIGNGNGYCRQRPNFLDATTHPYKIGRFRSSVRQSRVIFTSVIFIRWKPRFFSGGGECTTVPIISTTTNQQQPLQTTTKYNLEQKKRRIAFL